MVMDIPFDTGSFIGRYIPLAYYLGRKGHKITMFMPNHDPKKEGYSLKNAKNVFIYETGIPFFRKIDLGRRNYTTFILIKIGLENILRSMQLLKRLNPDLMIVCKPLPIAGIIGLLFKTLKGKKIVLDCDDAEIAINSVRSNLQRKIIRIFENLLPKLSHIVLINSEYTLNKVRMSGIPEDKIFYLPNGVDVKRFSNISHNPLLEKELGAHKVILYYGDLSFASGHNIDILLKAFRLFLSKCPSARLLIIGDGKDEGKLRHLALRLGIESKIIWKGRINPEEIPTYVAACDVVVDPVKNVISNWARCPLKIIEAMYLGKPVVTSDIGDRKKLLGDFGFFAHEGDPNSMAEKMLEAIENSEFEKNKHLVIKHALDYDWDKLTDKVEILLKQVLKK